MRYDIRNMSIWRETPEKMTSRSRNDFRSIRIEDLELSVRSFNSLKRGGCNTVGDIQNLLDEEGNGLRRIRNLGERSETEIKEKLEGLSRNNSSLPSEGRTDLSDTGDNVSNEARLKIFFCLPRSVWEKEIKEFHLSNYAEGRLRGCGISKIKDLYATHPKQEPGWYAVRELFRKIAEEERI